jgi:hypothetical protein
MHTFNVLSMDLIVQDDSLPAGSVVYWEAWACDERGRYEAEALDMVQAVQRTSDGRRLAGF